MNDISKPVLVLLLLVLSLSNYGQEKKVFTAEEVNRAYESVVLILFSHSFEINKKKIPNGIFKRNLTNELRKSI
jgi:hypothetical protein